MNWIKNRSLAFLAFLQATGLVIYLILLSLFFTFGTPKFNTPGAEFYAPIILLLVFIISAVISATLVLGRAGMFFWEKKYKEAFCTLFWTIGSGILYLILFLIIL